MKQCLEETGKVIVKSTGLEKFHQNERLALPSNTDCAWSVLATAYHLLRSNPSRFQRHDDAAGLAWGFHDEDWYRAVCVIKFVVQRRSSPMKPYARPRQPVDTYTCGYADEQSIQEANEADKDERNDVSAQIMQDETDNIDPIFKEEGPGNDAQLPTEDELRSLALQHPDISKIEDGVEQSKAIEVYISRCRANPELISELTTSCVVDNLARENPGIDLMDSLCRKSSNNPMIITASEKKMLRGWLQQMINVVHDGPGKDMIASCGAATLTTNEDLQGLSSRLDQERYENAFELHGAEELAGDVRELDRKLEEAEESNADRSAPEAEELLERRTRLGERLPDEEDLEALCELYSVNLETLQVNPHVYQTRNLPTQIPDAHHLKKLLQSPLRSGFLLSECGTGKTRVYCTMLNWLAKDRERQAREGKLDLAEGERVYKPIFIGLPAGVLDQCFNEINRDWSGIFEVYSFYSKIGQVKVAARSVKTLGTFDELQTLVNSLAEKSNDPKTGRTIILGAYTTITSRMTTGKNTEWVIKGKKASSDLNNPENDGSDAAQKLPANSVEASDGEPGQEVQKRERRSKLENSDWSVVIADDCHLLKNPCSVIHKVIASLPRESILFVSATPLSNHIRDIIGYLDMIWNVDWPFSYDETEGEIVDSYYHPESWKRIKEIGAFENITTERLVTGARKPDGSTEPSARARRHALEYESFIREGKGPLHLLNPQLFQDYAITHDWSTEVSTSAVKTIMDMMSLKRGMFSQMAMPDGTMTCLGKNLKDMTVRTIELQPLAADKEELAQFCESLSNDLIRQQESTAPEMVASGTIIAAPKQLLNTSALRRLMCVSTDLGNRRLTDNSGRLARLVKKTGITTRLLSNQRGGKDVAERIAAQMAKEKPRAAGGCQEVDSFSYTDGTGGLKFHFYNNRPSGAYSFPINRPAQIKAVAYHSPKYCYVINEALDAQEKGEKLLCYVNSPLTSQLLNALLVAAGVRTLHYMSRHAQSERDAAVAKFNDPKTPHTCLVTSLQLSAFGLNLHKACHRGIILENPINLSHTIQALGRLQRVGQTDDVEWKILLCRDSFDSYFEARNIAKFVTTLTSEGRIPPQIQGEHRVVCAYEILRDQLGQACSRYPRTRVKWNEMDSQVLYLEGLFYSALAQWMLANPDQAHAVDKEKIGSIALSWEPGTPLTTDHVTGQFEPLFSDQGVVLTSRMEEAVDPASVFVDETYESNDEEEAHEKKPTTSAGSVRKREENCLDEAIKKARIDRSL